VVGAWAWAGLSLSWAMASFSSSMVSTSSFMRCSCSALNRCGPPDHSPQPAAPGQRRPSAWHPAPPAHLRLSCVLKEVCSALTVMLWSHFPTQRRSRHTLCLLYAHSTMPPLLNVATSSVTEHRFPPFLAPSYGAGVGTVTGLHLGLRLVVVLLLVLLPLLHRALQSLACRLHVGSQLRSPSVSAPTRRAAEERDSRKKGVRGRH